MTKDKENSNVYSIRGCGHPQHPLRTPTASHRILPGGGARDQRQLPCRLYGEGSKWPDLVQALTSGVCGISLAMNSRCAAELAGSSRPKENRKSRRQLRHKVSYVGKAPRTQSCVLLDTLSSSRQWTETSFTPVAPAVLSFVQTRPPLLRADLPTAGYYQLHHPLTSRSPP